MFGVATYSLSILFDVLLNVDLTTFNNNKKRNEIKFDFYFFDFLLAKNQTCFNTIMCRTLVENSATVKGRSAMHREIIGFGKQKTNEKPRNCRRKLAENSMIFLWLGFRFLYFEKRQIVPVILLALVVNRLEHSALFYLSQYQLFRS